MSNISLTSAMSSNLLALKQTTSLMSMTQNRLATGLKVNSAIDNPSAYYTAVSLNNRAADLNALLDNMGQAIQTVKAANEGIDAGLAFLEQIKSVVEQAISQGNWESNVGEISSSGTGTNNSDVRLGNDSRPLYNGRENTQMIFKDYSPAWAASQFYAPGVDKDNEYFGQGKWYLPAIGELMVMYGVDTAAMAEDSYGVTGENITKINDALNKLGDDGQYIDGGYRVYDIDVDWFSSSMGYGEESYGRYGFVWHLNNGYYHINEYDTGWVRAFQHLENLYNPTSGQDAPQIGDVIYDDLSYGSADDYAAAKAAGKVAVGIINWVSDDNKDVKIVNLKTLTFTYTDFNPEHPYDGSQDGIGAEWWGVSGLEEYNAEQLVAEMIKNTPYVSGGGVAVTPPSNGADKNTEMIKAPDTTYGRQFNMILKEYDELIADASYRGINLLTGGQLNVIFNENRSHLFEVSGRDISSVGLGLARAEWQNMSDVITAQNDIQKAISVLRDFSSELGNHYSVVQSRQDFTESLINILTEGADKLTLADMNEESAIMLALQTRQQLAINSLSLASQSAQSVLRLFA